LFAAAREVDLEGLLFLILTVVAFGVSIYLAYVRAWVPALVALFIGLVLLVYAL
jgi:hypothetical protein